MEEIRRGHCMCGSVRYEYWGGEMWSVYCHCESCRRATSAPVVAWFGVVRSLVRFRGITPAFHESSPGVRRYFCPKCGSPMGYLSDTWPDEIHLLAATLEDPENFEPQSHVFYDEHLPWFQTDDLLPRHPGSGKK